MILVAVNAAGREQSEHVQRRGSLCTCGNGLYEFGIAGEAAVGNVLVNAGEVLINHAAGAEVHMSHLGIAHLPLWQAHC